MLDQLIRAALRELARLRGFPMEKRHPDVFDWINP